jgi:hypothetical protein
MTILRRALIASGREEDLADGAISVEENATELDLISAINQWRVPQLLVNSASDCSGRSMRSAFAAAGVEFTNGEQPGVRIRKGAGA